MYPTHTEFVSPHPFVILNFLRTFSLKDSFSINRGFFFCFGTGVSLTLLMTAVFKKPSAGEKLNLTLEIRDNIKFFQRKF